MILESEDSPAQAAYEGLQHTRLNALARLGIVLAHAASLQIRYKRRGSHGREIHLQALCRRAL